jgi:1,4-alpha-glucan branching enzyme
MRKNKSKQLSPNGASTASVQLEYTDPMAAAVCVAGTFNDWRPEATQMVALGDGRWRKELVLPPGRYEYLLVVDGRWEPDPEAAERVANPFGGQNGVLAVPAIEAPTKGDKG